MDSRPNILVIVTDQGICPPGIAGRGVALRNRDRIRSRGLPSIIIRRQQRYVHRRARSCGPASTPFTRMFDNTNFAWIEDMRADAATLPTIGHMLRELGYYTAYKGKWHESGVCRGQHKGRHGTLWLCRLPGMGMPMARRSTGSRRIRRLLPTRPAGWPTAPRLHSRSLVPGRIPIKPP